MRVIFPLVKQVGTNLVEYPDTRSLFSNIKTEGLNIIADYAGSLILTEYTAVDEAKRAEKLAQVREKYEAQRVALLSLPQEQATWDRQTAEYDAYMLNNLAPTDAIDGLVAGDNLVGGTITKAELIAKIGANITAYVNAVATITGMQHGYERKISACTTQAELDAIVIG